MTSVPVVKQSQVSQEYQGVRMPPCRLLDERNSHPRVGQLLCRLSGDSYGRGKAL